MEILVLWVFFCFLSFGVLGVSFILMRKAAMKPWRLKIDGNYVPEVSILVPTYNESNIIRYKLENLNRIDYPKDLVNIIVVDSNSNDRTLDIVDNFAKQHPETNIEVVIEGKRKGKSAALNSALQRCDGDVIIVSDADCFWPSDILRKGLPFLADPNVGAVSGPKTLLNSKQSWATKNERDYLNLMSIMTLGQSKCGSTLFFEGGFSAYKKEVLESFDPYNTGSDDCGTIIKLAEKNLKAILIPETRFYTTFPLSWRERISIKVRRANQIVRVLLRYVYLLSTNRVKGSKGVIVQGILVYLLGPVMFILFLATTILLLSRSAHFALIFLVLLIPKVRNYLLEAIQNYLVLLVSLFAVTINRKFVVWAKPKDRILVREDILRKHELI